jgi:hypothetical protein
MSHTYGAEDPWPVGVWVRLSHPNFARAIWFTYVDPDMGFSAATDRLQGPGSPPGFCVARLPEAWTTCELLSEAEIAEFSLPAKPDWLESYGPQPPPGTLWGTWRNDPRLKGKFHPEYPDDLQVIVHDGGPHMTKHRPELIWVRVTGYKHRVFIGRVLSQPHQLESIRQNSIIRFLVPEGGDYPLMVTDKYLAERDNWIIYPCQKCGLSEILDAPSDLYPVIFPNTPDTEVVVSFTSRCGTCADGCQVVENINSPSREERSLQDKAAKERRVA